MIQGAEWLCHMDWTNINNLALLSLLQMGVLDWKAPNDCLHQVMQVIWYGTTITGGEGAWNQWLHVECHHYDFLVCLCRMDLTFFNFLNFIFTWDWSRPPMFSMFTWLMFIPFSYVSHFTQSHGQEKSLLYYDLFDFGVLLYGRIPTLIFFFHFFYTPTPILTIQVLIIQANLKKSIRRPWCIEKRKIPRIWWRTLFGPN